MTVDESFATLSYKDLYIHRRSDACQAQKDDVAEELRSYLLACVLAVIPFRHSHAPNLSKSPAVAVDFHCDERVAGIVDLVRDLLWTVYSERV